MYATDDDSPWNKLRKQLLLPPTEEPPRVDIKDVSQTIHGVTKFALEWERRNVPVIIENCARNWKAMPVYDKRTKQTFGMEEDRVDGRKSLDTGLLFSMIEILSNPVFAFSDLRIC